MLTQLGKIIFNRLTVPKETLSVPTVLSEHPNCIRSEYVARVIPM
jgi:hypothetical protein